ncbi:MAG: UDP-N-acetylmuramate dehydrogenase, partial [bacterium]|nr:UDP-N-acetylmuramate dehydrogenase [bacterium]
IGGTARFVLDVSSVDDVFEAVAFIQRNKIEKYMVVGLGTNLLMPDEEYKGAIIRFPPPRRDDMHMTNDGLVAVFAGHTLDQLIHFSFHNGFIGLENLGGLPSTLGGAIRGNAGAFGTEMKDVVVKVSAIEVSRASYAVREFTSEACEFSYRNSIFKKRPNLIVLKGFLHLKAASKQQLKDAKETYIEKVKYREAKHPVEYPSCGSVFTNIRISGQIEKIISVWPDIAEKVRDEWHGKVSMGYVIKRLGFSGTQVGGAKITEKHANYICNVDHAKAKDVLAIIEEIKKKFVKTFGFSPELEAEIVM